MYSIAEQFAAHLCGRVSTGTSRAYLSDVNGFLQAISFAGNTDAITDGAVEALSLIHIYTEHYVIPQETVDIIERCKAEGHRVISVGTTSTRTLESCYQKNGKLMAFSDDTDIFIYPGYKFGVIDGLITNFHLPESTLIMLVSALAGRENVLHAYRVAVEEEYRFYSFGDAMFIL